MKYVTEELDVAELRSARRMNELQRYAVPIHDAPVDLYLASNEGRAPRGLRLPSIDAPNRYPDTNALRSLLAERMAVSAESVVLTCGADDALFRVILAMLEPGREALVAVPTFEMIPRYVALSGGSLREVAWPSGAYPVAEVIENISAKTALVLVVSPNNPTGGVVQRAELERIALAAPNALVVLDHAYCEFGDEDLTSCALSLPNVLCLRTFSKAWGLAGLRVGYAVGAPEVVAMLGRAGNPYPVASLSAAIACERLTSGVDDMEDHVERVRIERAELVRELSSLGARCERSRGNFVLARTDRASWLRDALAGLGIAVRVFPNTPGLDDAVRITCPADVKSFERLLAALRAALAPEALLFDMDGVLADVSGSYRRAIVETARDFGVVVTAEDIRELKAKGDANDDWELTRRLLTARGVSVPIEEVRERFERLYQGTEARPGFREEETLLLTRETLERLRSRVPLAVVTGRPRADAERFLVGQGIDDLFAAVVCREDAPLKPDPAPVRVALERLGVQRAWMLGDSPDDVRAARSAGVVPLGCLAPGDGGAPEVLTRAGAARVFEKPCEVEEIL